MIICKCCGKELKTMNLYYKKEWYCSVDCALKDDKKREETKKIFEGLIEEEIKAKNPITIKMPVMKLNIPFIDDNKGENKVAPIGEMINNYKRKK